MFVLYLCCLRNPLYTKQQKFGPTELRAFSECKIHVAPIVISQLIPLPHIPDFKRP